MAPKVTYCISADQSLDGNRWATNQVVDVIVFSINIIVLRTKMTLFTKNNNIDNATCSPTNTCQHLYSTLLVL